MSRTDKASRFIRASAQTVYQAFAHAGAMEQWLPPHDMKGTMLAFDFRDGGHYRMRLVYPDADNASAKSDDNSDVVSVNLINVLENALIVQSVEFDSDNPAFSGVMTITWRFEPQAEGTQVTVTCENVPSGISAQDHQDGLSSSLENLARFTEAAPLQQTMQQTTDFFLQLDKLKSVQRRSYINGGERPENSAEHSWHLAMACWTFARLMPGEFDENKLIKMALVHDIGEIGAGDTFLYGAARSTAHIKEREYIQQLAAHPGNTIADLPEIWEEQETGQSKEARLLKVLDRLLPVLLNLNSEGRAWQDNHVKRSQVNAMHRFIADEYPAIHRWLMAELDEAVAKGWLMAG